MGQVLRPVPFSTISLRPDYHLGGSGKMTSLGLCCRIFLSLQSVASLRKRHHHGSGALQRGFIQCSTWLPRVISIAACEEVNATCWFMFKRRTAFTKNNFTVPICHCSKLCRCSVQPGLAKTKPEESRRTKYVPVNNGKIGLSGICVVYTWLRSICKNRKRIFSRLIPIFTEIILSWCRSTPELRFHFNSHISLYILALINPIRTVQQSYLVSLAAYTFLYSSFRIFEKYDSPIFSVASQS